MSNDDWGSDDDGGWGDDAAEASATPPPAHPPVACKQLSAECVACCARACVIVKNGVKTV